MIGNQLPFIEGASINRTPLLCGVNYLFWKVCMKISMELVNGKLLLMAIQFQLK